MDTPDTRQLEADARSRKERGPHRLSALLYSSCAPVIANALARLLADPPDREALAEIARLSVCSPHDRLSASMQRVAMLAASSDVEACRAEYVRLFVRRSGAAILPWESTWVEIPPRLGGRRHVDALRFYARAGYLPHHANAPADHIATELAFVALLAQRQQKELLHEFWHAHVLPWMPAFARKLKLETREPLYAAVADLLIASATPVPSAERQRELRMR